MERFIRLTSLFVLGMGLVLGLGYLENRPRIVAAPPEPHNPSLEIEAANEIARINRGELDSKEPSTVKGRTTKEMAANLSEQ